MDRNRWLALAVLAALLAPAPAAGAQIEGGESVVIEAGEVRDDDVIVAAGTFLLAGRVRGDLIVMGGTVTLAPGGVVEGDLIAAGRSIVLGGQVLDDARVAGAVLTVGERAAVGDDLIAGGQSLETRPGSSVGGELLFGGGQALLAGTVARGARVGAGGMELQGRIAGDLAAAVGKAGEAPPFSPLAFFPELPPVPRVAPGLTSREGARIGGNLEYVAEQETVLPAGVVAGRVARRAPAQEEDRVSPAARALQTLGALLVMGLLMVAVAPSTVTGCAEVLRSRPGPSLGWGVAGLFGAFAGVPSLALATALAAILLGVLSFGTLTAVTILSGIVAILAWVLAFAVALLYVSKVVVAYLGGRLLLARVKAGWVAGRVAPLLVGVLALALLGALPVLGGLLHLLASLLGLGALWLLARERFRRRWSQRAAGEPAPQEAAMPAAA